MITRVGSNLFLIETIGERVGLGLDGAELVELLEKTGVWSAEQIEGVLALGLFEHTVKPHAVRGGGDGGSGIGRSSASAPCHRRVGRETGNQRGGREVTKRERVALIRRLDRMTAKVAQKRDELRAIISDHEALVESVTSGEEELSEALSLLRRAGDSLQSADETLSQYA